MVPIRGFNSAGYVKLAAICCLLFVFSCKSRKPLVVKRVAADTVAAIKPVDTKAAKLVAIKAKQTSFNTFSGKASTKLDINGNSNNVTLNIRIQRDHKIWVSITAIAGIEVARAQITPDSIFLVNRCKVCMFVSRSVMLINTLANRSTTKPWNRCLLATPFLNC